MEQKPSDRDIVQSGHPLAALTSQQRKVALAGLLAVGVVTWGSYLLLRFIWHIFVGLPPGVAPAIITACGTILTATATVMAARHLERKKELAVLHREKKTAIYDEFLKKLFQIVGVKTSKGSESVEEINIVEFLNEWQRTLILWAGPATVASYCQWRTKLMTAPHSLGTLLSLEGLLLAIREDIGHSNTGLLKGQISSKFLRNAEQLMAIGEANPHISMVDAERALKELMLRSQSQDQDSGHQ